MAKSFNMVLVRFLVSVCMCWGRNSNSSSISLPSTMLTNRYDCRAIMSPTLGGGCLSWGKEDTANACQLPLQPEQMQNSLLQEDILPLPSLHVAQGR